MVSPMSNTSVKPALKRDRLLYLDIARTIAIISITFNHAVNRTYDNYNNQYAQFLESSFFIKKTGLKKQNCSERVAT